MDFQGFALLLVLAAVCAFFLRFLRQPLLVGYIIAGLIIGASGLIEEPETFRTLSQFGVTLLLFLLGLEMNISEIASIGKTALIAGLGEIGIAGVLGFLLSTLLGLPVIPSLYVSVALTFSSTIIMVKLLSEKRDLQSLYGRIAVGYLVVQDLVAVFILMFLSSLKTGETGVIAYSLIFLKGLILLILTILISKYVLPIIFEKYVSSSGELLFIMSIAWAVGFATLTAGPFGFTLEIGGLLAGLALSNLPEHLQIASRAKSLRDFFLVIFFVLLGVELSVYGNFFEVIVPALVLSLFVLIVNPLIVLIILGLLGYRKRTFFMAGLVTAQISEFSLILMSVGKNLGHVNQSNVSLVVLIGVITMTISTYLILGSEKVYKLLLPYLGVFERKSPKERAFIKETGLTNHIVLIGCDRTGRSLVSYFKKKEIPFIVIDFNPKVFSRLTADNVPVIFGDCNDQEILEAAHIESAAAIISTIGNFMDNAQILSYIKTTNEKPLTIFTSSGRHDAVRLYEAGASYVLVPEAITGEYIKNLFKTHGVNKHKFSIAGKNHFKRILLSS